jgi:hypothetical protein
VTRVLITGSRTWTDRAVIRRALAEVWVGDPATVLVSGGSPTGADVLCEQCWTHWGGHLERHPARWSRHGRTAGFVRNQLLVTLGAQLCVAFIRDHSRGASHTVALAHTAGIPVVLYTNTGHYTHGPGEPR